MTLQEAARPDGTILVVADPGTDMPPPAETDHVRESREWGRIRVNTAAGSYELHLEHFPVGQSRNFIAVAFPHVVV
jgi:hypothetical protein